MKNIHIDEDLTKKFKLENILNDKDFQRHLVNSKDPIQDITCNELKRGDIVVIQSGYNDDINYRIEVLGFDKEGMCYFVWDCWWMPQDLSKCLIHIEK